jgi:hypothetical protein
MTTFYKCPITDQSLLEYDFIEVEPGEFYYKPQKNELGYYSDLILTKSPDVPSFYSTTEGITVRGAQDLFLLMISKKLGFLTKEQERTYALLQCIEEINQAKERRRIKERYYYDKCKGLVPFKTGTSLHVESEFYKVEDKIVKLYYTIGGDYNNPLIEIEDVFED